MYLFLVSAVNQVFNLQQTTKMDASPSQNHDSDLTWWNLLSNEAQNQPYVSESAFTAPSPDSISQTMQTPWIHPQHEGGVHDPYPAGMHAASNSGATRDQYRPQYLEYPTCTNNRMLTSEAAVPNVFTTGTCAQYGGPVGAYVSTPTFAQLQYGCVHHDRYQNSYLYGPVQDYSATGHSTPSRDLALTQPLKNGHYLKLQCIHCTGHLFVCCCGKMYPNYPELYMCNHNVKKQCRD